MADAGWYGDPGGEPQLRYFDGARWTEQTRAFPTPSGPPIGLDPEVPSHEGRPWWRTRHGALAAVAGGLLALGGAGVAVASLSQGTPEEPAVEAAATDDAPESEAPEPEPEPDSVDLRGLAWDEQKWTTACVESGEPTPVSLHPDEESGELSSAVGSDRELDTTAMNYTVDVDSLTYGDLTSDGLDDAVFATDCFLGNDYVHYVEVWSHDDAGQPVQLPAVVTYTKRDGTIDSHDVEDGVLIIHTSEPAPGDEVPHLNGYPVQVVTSWQFDGSTWLPEEVSRTDTTPPAPEPAPEPQPEPEPQPSSEPSICEQLGFDVFSDDDAYCMQLQADLEECSRQMDADPDYVPDPDGSGYINIHTGEWEPPCDV